MRKIKQVLLLAGGDSTRFWPLSDKNLTRFLGKELIIHQIGALKPYVEKICIVANKNNKEKIDFVVSGMDPFVEILIQDKHLTGQAGAILSARNRINGEVLVMNANDIFNHSILKNLIKKTDEGKSRMILLAKEVKEYFPGGYLRFNKKTIAEIVEKPHPDKTPSNIVRLVVDYFSDYNELVSTIERTRIERDDWYEISMNALIEKKSSVDYILYKDYWFSLKFPWHVLAFSKFYLNELDDQTIEDGVVISPNTVIVPPVYIGKGCRIGDFSKIVGPCFIDENTTIGDHTLVRESNIGKHCMIGGYSEVTRSYIADGVMLHRNYVGDSILDHEVSMGSGATTANYRFDEGTVSSDVNGVRVNSQLKKFGAVIGANSKVGVQTSILPGIKIGSQTFIAPGNIIDEDIADRMYAMKGKMRKNLYFK